MDTRLDDILNNPDLLTDQDQNLIDQVIEEYPYFQAVYALKLKLLKTKTVLNTIVFSERLHPEQASAAFCLISSHEKISIN